MKIVEFNGLPGSGKTTLSNNCYNLLKDAQKDNVYIYNKESSKKYLKHSILKNFFSFFLVGVKNLRDLMMLSFYSGNGLGLEQLRIILMSLKYIIFYKAIEKENGYCFVEQGFIQSLVSIIYDKDINSNNKERVLIRRLLKRYCINRGIVCINVDLSSEVAVNRLRNRNHTNISRVELLSSDSDIIKIYNQQKRTLQFIRNALEENKMHVININANKDIERNSNVILNALKFKEI